MCTPHQEGIFYFVPDKKVLRISTIVVNMYLKTMNCETSGEYPTIVLNTAILGNCLYSAIVYIARAAVILSF